MESVCRKSCTVSTDQGSTNQVTKLEVTFRPAGGPALTLEDMETGAHAWSGLKVEPAVQTTGFSVDLKEVNGQGEFGLSEIVVFGCKTDQGIYS